ncbi:hypothetical protein Nepgr_009200 [Nepenthes gracilis]|uniref:ClpA/ClpB AAA lid domain-containing protein n=1 Tax=Nepenthes gracilis TaxID=150966 RepID=A0AAD3SAE2_NEPGR|nr:hypothetical protein Nepgr_009200 [Nepenthes gracilis]
MICDRFSIRLEKSGNEQFLVEHERPGYTSLSLSRQITLWPLEMHSVPPLQNTLGWWCIHATINSSSLEDHIGCKASPRTEDDGVDVFWSQCSPSPVELNKRHGENEQFPFSQPFGPTNCLSTDEKLQESIEMDEFQGALPPNNKLLLKFVKFPASRLAKHLCDRYGHVQSMTSSALKHYTQPRECQSGWATPGQIHLSFPQAHLSSFQASRSSKLHHALSIAQIQDRANAWLNASQATRVPIVCTNIPTKSLLTKISAIDLVDEAAAKLKMEITSKPSELDEIDREILKLEMEKLSLKNDTDKASKERLQKLESDLAKIKTKSKELP